MDERRSWEGAPEPRPDPDTTKSAGASLGPGSLLKQRYLIVRELSSGGFGRVFLADDTQIHNRPVVIKIRLDQELKDPWFERKFSEELRALALIDHPGVVGVLDSGQTGDGTPFLVMQYIAGVTLRTVLTPEGLPLDRVANLVHQIGQALGAAHDKKVWHRDLKPENIMLQTLPGGDEHVRLIDFGISTIADVTVKQTRVAGSLPYMAPEQVTGLPNSATDTYAFGVIVHEMLTGRKPFVAENAVQLAELQRAGVRVKPSALRPAIPPEAEKLILQSLSYNPHARPASAREFGDSLRHALLTAASTERSGDTGRRSRIWAAVAAAAVVLTSLGVWIYGGRTSGVQPLSATPTAAVQAPAPAQEQKHSTKKSDGKTVESSRAPAAAQRTTSARPHPDGTPALVPAPRQERKLNVPMKGFTTLFNGKDLSGWRGRPQDFPPLVEAALSPEEHAEKQKQWNSQRDLRWRVDPDKGEIVCSGRGPNLATVKDFGDFELYVDWLMVNRNGDSGILLRGYPQVQIWDVDNPAFPGAARGSGALWNNKAYSPAKWPLVKADNPVGQWNTFRIKMIGSYVWVWLNDKLTVNAQALDNSFDYSRPLVARGPIELQAYDLEFRFRNIFIREIPPGGN